MTHEVSKAGRVPADSAAVLPGVPVSRPTEVGGAAQAALGLALAAAAIGLRWALDPVLGNRQPYTPAYGAVALAVWYGGWRAAVVTLVSCHVAATYWFVAPRGEWVWSLQEAVGSATYYIIGSTIIFFGHRATSSNRALQQALMRLRESDRRRMRFLAVLAHELRNPLATLNSAITVMNSPMAERAQVDAMGRIAARQVAQLGHLIDDLLDVSRIDQGTIRLQRQPLSVARVVADAVAAARAVSDPKAQHLDVTMPPDDPCIDADPVRITQVLNNLLQNAVKFSPPEATIALDVRIEAGQVVISVRDSGAGIPADAIDAIFQPFVQLGSTGCHADGLGLGLPLVKTLVELHGGSVSAASDGAGRGSVFEVRLPLAGVAAAARAA